MPVTMQDVAIRAGVSAKTVSRVVNNQGEISDLTRKHVMNVIRELDYRPNTVARSLASGKTLSIALIIPQITDPFFPQVVLGVESVASQHGYSVFLYNTSNDPQREIEYIDILAGRQVDGFILCGSRLNEEQLATLSEHYSLAVLTNRKPCNAPMISLSGEIGLFELTSHLINIGHTAIAHLGREGEAIRLNGYRRALSEHGLKACSDWLSAIPNISIGESREAAKRLLKQAHGITAVTCYNDLVAIGVIQACEELGYKVPETIAVVGFDDIEFASVVRPALTTMHVPRYKLGQQLMELLLRVITNGSTANELIHVTPSLIVRDSCGAKIIQKGGFEKAAR